MRYVFRRLSVFVLIIPSLSLMMILGLLQWELQSAYDDIDSTTIITSSPHDRIAVITDSVGTGGLSDTTLGERPTLAGLWQWAKLMTSHRTLPTITKEKSVGPYLYSKLVSELSHSALLSQEDWSIQRYFQLKHDKPTGIFLISHWALSYKSKLLKLPQYPQIKHLLVSLGRYDLLDKNPKDPPNHKEILKGLQDSFPNAIIYVLGVPPIYQEENLSSRLFGYDSVSPLRHSFPFSETGLTTLNIQESRQFEADRVKFNFMLEKTVSSLKPRKRHNQEPKSRIIYLPPFSHAKGGQQENYAIDGQNLSRKGHKTWAEHTRQFLNSLEMGLAH